MSRVLSLLMILVLVQTPNQGAVVSIPWDEILSWPGTKGELLDLFRMEAEVRRELNASKEVETKANELFEERRQYIRSLKIPVEDGPGFSEQYKLLFRKKMEVDLALIALLNPDQQKRLAQLYARHVTTQDLFGARLASSFTAKELKLTEVQMREVAARAVANENAFWEMAREFERDMTKVQTDLRGECEQVLSPEQRKELHLLFGRPFYFQNPSTGIGAVEILARPEPAKPKVIPSSSAKSEPQP